MPPEPAPRERLQPSLLDRLTDEVKGLERERDRLEELVLPALDAPMREALARLLDPERRDPWRPATAEELAPFASLAPERRDLVRRLIETEQRRQIELRQRVVVSTERLRDVVLRDLRALFNTENLRWREAREVLPTLRSVPDIDEFPYAAKSVVNFGIPPLAGRTGASLDLDRLERELEDAIKTFEPRLKRDTVSVRSVRREEGTAGSQLAFEIEAELWAEPLPLRLWLRTLIDLETGSARIEAEGA